MQLLQLGQLDVLPVCATDFEQEIYTMCTHNTKRLRVKAADAEVKVAIEYRKLRAQAGLPAVPFPPHLEAKHPAAHSTWAPHVRLPCRS